jgi:hypothetical protein
MNTPREDPTGTVAVQGAVTRSWEPRPPSRAPWPSQGPESSPSATLGGAGDWRDDELGDVLAHQLDAPLHADLLPGPPNGGDGPSAASAAVPPIVTFRDLLFHPVPPPDLLRAAGAFAAVRLSGAAGAYPPGVARAARAAAWAAERCRGLGPRDGRGDRQAEVEWEWLARQPWADAAVRRLAGDALAAAAVAPPPAAGPSDPPRAAPADDLTGAPSLDGYAVTGRLGEGGMGVVWRAVQLSTGRTVALKLMGTASFGSERARLRFRREVRLTARLDHPQIARVYDSGLHRGAYYYAMELIDGVPLDRFVRDGKPDGRQVLALVRSACGAVDHAHRRGIVHRDLKPGNILVDAAGTPHVLDFGLAKALQDAQTDAALTYDGDLAGTPAFMAPEQAAGAAGGCDARADVYSLGVVLFNLLSGSFPHDVTGSRMDVLRRISEEEPRALSDALPGADPDLERLLRTALARWPAARPATAGDLAAAIDAYLAGRRHVNRRPFVPRRWAYRLRRLRPRPMVAGVLVACLALGAFVVPVWRWGGAALKPAGAAARPEVPGALPPAADGPWFAAAYYAKPGTPHVLDLHAGRAAGQVQAWVVDWGEGDLERLRGSAETAEHAYKVDGRHKVRAWAVSADGSTYRASTSGRPVYRWAAEQGGNDHYYTLTNVRGYWHALLWESWGRGGYIATVGSSREQAFLERTFLGGAAADAAWYWIGLTEIPQHWLAGSDGDFRWNNDEAVAYTNWAPGRPDHRASNSDSAAMNYARAAGDRTAGVGGWADLSDQDVSDAAGSPARSMPAIVEFDRPPPDELEVVVYSAYAPKARPRPSTLPASPATGPTTRSHPPASRW